MVWTFCTSAWHTDDPVNGDNQRLTCSDVSKEYVFSTLVCVTQATSWHQASGNISVILQCM
jgi:hypothetical protein